MNPTSKSARKADPDPAAHEALPLTESTGVLAPPPAPAIALRRVLPIVTLGWVFGSVWMTATAGAPITQFASRLGATPFQFGVLSALPFLAALASVPASLLIERTGQRKKIFFWGLYLQRLLWFPIAIAPLWIVHQYGMRTAPVAIGLFLTLIFIMHLGQAIGGPAWLSWMADVVPERIRGRFFSRRRQWGTLSAIPAALFVGWLLDRHAGANDLVMLGWCVIIFLCAAFFGLIDIAVFHVVPDVPKKPRAGAHLLRTFSKPLRDREFLYSAGYVATMVFAVSFMGQFVTLFLLERVGVNNSRTQLMLLIFPMLAQLLLFPIWGRAADRMGKKPLLALSSLGLVPVGFAWCWVGPESIWLGYLLAALGGGLWAGVEVANLNLVLEFSGSRDEDGNEHDGGGTGYVAVNSIISSIAGFCGGISSGAIAQWLQHLNWNPGVPGITSITFYEILFALSGVLRLLSVVVFLPHVHEPEARPTREALRFMTANIYNNLFNAIMQPLRLVGVGKDEDEDDRENTERPSR